VVCRRAGLARDGACGEALAPSPSAAELELARTVQDAARALAGRLRRSD
jgi:hypothetical protein